MRNPIGTYGAVAAFSLAILFAAGAAAQERREGRGFLMGGAQGMDIGDLNDRLSANGYGTFSEAFALVGGGGYGIVGRFLIGGEGVGIFTGNESAALDADFFKTTLSGGYGLLKMGYILYQRGGFVFYPAFGIGGGGLSLEISREATLPFDQFLRNPRRSAHLGNGFLLLDLGLGADNLVVLNRRGEEESGVVIGAHAGYLFAPYRSDWGDALDGPDAAIQGAYFRLVFGGGGTGRR